MRKLWPPPHDDFSVRFWATSFSILLSLFGVVWALHGGVPDIIWWFGFPGAFVFVTIAGGIEEAGGWRAWCGLAGWLASNMFFYYLVASFVIRAFRPATSWWPEKRS